MNETDVWVASVKVSLDELEKQINRMRESVKAFINLEIDALEFTRTMREMGVIE